MRLLSLATFLVLFTASAFAGGTVGFNLTWYLTPGFPFVDENFPVTTGVVIADFNRDGILDVAYSFPCNSSCAAVILKMGTGGGNLGPDISYQWGASSLAELETADINGDGWLDIVVRDVLDSKLTLLLNSGDGTFQPFSLIFTGGSYLSSFTLGDFNHDGKLDLAEIGCDAPDAGFPFGYANCDLYVYQGDSTGGFTQVQVITLKGPSFNLQSADINGDGNLDLVYVRDRIDSTGPKISSLGDGHVVGDVGEHRGLHIVALVQALGPAGAADDQGRALVDALLDQPWILSNWTLETTGPSWLLPFGSPTVTLGRRLAGHGDRLVHPLGGDQHAGGRVAGLAGVGHHRRHAAADALGEDVVVEDDVRALAAQLLVHPLDGRGGGLGHLDAGPGRAGEGDHVHFRVAGDRRADRRAVAVHQVEHARRARPPHA